MKEKSSFTAFLPASDALRRMAVLGQRSRRSRWRSLVFAASHDGGTGQNHCLYGMRHPIDRHPHLRLLRHAAEQIRQGADVMFILRPVSPR